MKSKILTLSSAGLKNIIFGGFLEEDFSFIFSGQQISMKSLCAEFISPKISKLHQSDPTINFIYFKDPINGIQFTEGVLSKFKKISYGESIEINEKESFEMKIISILLENDILLSQLNSLFPIIINESTINHYLTYLTALSQMSQSPDYNEIIDFISSHFYSFDKSNIKKMPKTVIYSIISNPKLKIESEDSLFEFINELFENKTEDPELISEFYEEIEFTQLSENKFDEFVDSINPSYITRKLWCKLCLCFHTNKQKNEVDQKRYTKNEKSETRDKENAFNKFYEGRPFEGIINELTKIYEGNVNDKKIVDISGNKYKGHAGSFSSLVDYNYNECSYDSQDEPNSFICFDFKDHLVDLSAYSIKSTKNPRPSFLQSWVIEGSNDNIKWVNLDLHSNDQSLCSKGKVCTFYIQKDKNCDQSFRFIRLKMTGKASTNNYYLEIINIEFFGKYSINTL